jgi:hypothetical protein
MKKRSINKTSSIGIREKRRNEKEKKNAYAIKLK